MLLQNNVYKSKMEKSLINPNQCQNRLPVVELIVSRGGCNMRPQVDPSIVIGMKRSYEASISNFLFGSVGSSHSFIPNFWHWFGFISDFSILLPNYKPCPNYSITTSPEWSTNAVTPVHIGIFTCSVYYGRNGYTEHSSEVNDIGRNFAPKQCV